MKPQFPVTELVEMRLSKPWGQFLPTFEAEFLPTLMAAPGIISVRTGPKLVGADGHVEPYSAVSITQWTSLQAHQDFTASASAQRFFDGIAGLTEGPSLVAHYDLGELRSCEHLPFIRVHKCHARDGTAQLVDRLRTGASDWRVGLCVEDDRAVLTLKFYLSGASMRRAVNDAHGVSGSSFDIHVQSLRVTPDTAHL